jgi:hypothetical protein
MKSAAVGFRAHSGWTAVVALSATKGVPSVLARQRVHLVDIFTYQFRQPYHTAERMLPDEAQAFISRVEAEASRLAHRAIHELKESLLAQGYELKRCGLVLASGRPLPALPQILASHALIHTADGELFRRAILDASTHNGLAKATIKERELLSEASRVLRIKPGDLTRRIAGLGKPLGPPWSQDEKLASLVAWLALASRSSRASPLQRTSRDAFLSCFASAIIFAVGNSQRRERYLNVLPKLQSGVPGWLHAVRGLRHCARLAPRRCGRSVQ